MLRVTKLRFIILCIITKILVILSVSMINLLSEFILNVYILSVFMRYLIA